MRIGLDFVMRGTEDGAGGGHEKQIGSDTDNGGGKVVLGVEGEEVRDGIVGMDTEDVIGGMSVEGCGGADSGACAIMREGAGGKVAGSVG